MIVSDNWPKLLKEINSGYRDPSELDQFLVNGYLLVTPQEYKTLREEGDREFLHRATRGLPEPSPLASVPVLVVYPGKMLDVGDGWHAENQSGCIYVFNINQQLDIIQKILREFE
jgi:hypothetical protein